ncbi:MAG: FHA domain-containing protein [Gammaproteobacteria bacterium]
MAVLIQYANGVPAVKFPLDQMSLSIGRSEDNDICLADRYASKAHAVIELRAGAQGPRFFVRDMQSTNHTYVNNESVSEKALHAGDILQIGKSQFKFMQNPHEVMVSQEEDETSVCQDLSQELSQGLTLREEQFDKRLSRRISLF